jgi:hypothetical protein
MAVFVYRIYPAVAIARIGDSDQFYLGPEKDADLHENPTGHSQAPTAGRLYRDNTAAPGKILRQAARFRIFEFKYSNASASAPAAVREVTSQDWDIRWSVELANKKSFAVGQPSRSETNRILTSSASGSLDSASTTPVSIDRAIPGGPNVNLATLRPGGGGRLLIVPGAGNRGHLHATVDAAKSALGQASAGWWDDLGDGPVRAEIRKKNTSGEFKPVVGAWVVLTAPAYSGPVRHVITLYDLIFEVYWSQKGLNSVARGGLSANAFSFRTDVHPVLHRASLSSWVTNNAMQAHGPGKVADYTDGSRLTLLGSTKSTAATSARDKIQKRVRTSQTSPAVTGISMPPPGMGAPTAFQLRAFDAWVNDPAFGLDWTTPAKLSALDEPMAITRCYLSTATGGVFAPGVEVGHIVTKPDTWALDPPPGMKTTSWDDAFRVDASKRAAGDLTRDCPVPWHIDLFRMCFGRPAGGPLPHGIHPVWPGTRPLEVVSAQTNSMKLWDFLATTPDPGFEATTRWVEMGFLRKVVSPGGPIQYLDDERIAAYPP